MSIRSPLHRFTADDFDRMAEAGIFSKDERVELIEGEVVVAPPVSARHTTVVDRLRMLLVGLLRDQADVRVERPVRLDAYTETLPDVTLVRRAMDRRRTGHPGPQDVLLIVEVTETDADYTTDVKVPLYARAGVPEVWLVDFSRGCVTARRRPTPQGYVDTLLYGRSEPLTLNGLPDLLVAVREFLY